MRVQSITVPLPRLLSLNGGAIDRPKNVPDGLQNRYPAVDKWPCSLPFQFFDLTGSHNYQCRACWYISTPSQLRARRTQIAGYPVLPSDSCYERQPCLPGSKANRHLKRQGISYCRVARVTQPTARIRRSAVETRYSLGDQLFWISTQ